MKVVINKNMQAFPRLSTEQQALSLEIEDLGGPILTLLGAVHRKQQSRIFASQGAEGGSGRWPELSESYLRRKRGASRKRRVAVPGSSLGLNIFSAASALSISGRGKILVLTGDMKRRFTQASAPEYTQEYVASGGSSGLFRFGARSDVAAAHVAGNAGLAPRQSYQARRVFGGLAKNLPVRNMIAKTATQLHEFNVALNKWYQQRVRGVLRARGIKTTSVKRGT